MRTNKRTLTIDVSKLSERHVRALDYAIDKFIRGAVSHGDFKKGRKWTKDMIDEAIDKSYYEIFTLLDMEDAELED